MKLLKKSERIIKTTSYLQTLRSISYTTKHLVEFRKWKQLLDGSRLSVKLDLYECYSSTMNQHFYFLSDSLDKVATQMLEDKNEILDWINEHGYKTDKEFYLKDYGMTEEAWGEWNK